MTLIKAIRFMKSCICIVVLSAFLFVLVSSITIQSASALSLRKVQMDERDNAESLEYFGYLNSSREQAGLAPLVLSGVLTDTAKGHADFMGSRNKLVHATDLSKRCSQAGPWTSCSENVGATTDTSDDIARIAQQFMGSPQHKNNILDPNVTTVGIGVSHMNGQMWIVVRFKNDVDQAPVVQSSAPETTTPAPRVKPARVVEITQAPTTTSTTTTTTTLPRRIDPVPASTPLTVSLKTSVMFSQVSNVNVSLQSLSLVPAK